MSRRMTSQLHWASLTDELSPRLSDGVGLPSVIRMTMFGASSRSPWPLASTCDVIVKPACVFVRPMAYESKHIQILDVRSRRKMFDETEMIFSLCHTSWSEIVIQLTKSWHQVRFIIFSVLRQIKLQFCPESAKPRLLCFKHGTSVHLMQFDKFVW